MHYQLVEIARLNEIAESDRRFDLFDRTAPALLERARRGFVPLLLSADGTRLLWGFAVLRIVRSASEGNVAGRNTRFEELSALPVVTLSSESADELEHVLICEGRPGDYGWMERLRLSRLITPENASLVVPLIQPQGDPLAAIERFAALPEREQLLVDGESIDIRTAEMITILDGEALKGLLSGSEALSFSRRRVTLASFAEYVSGNGLSGAEQREAVGEASATGDVETAVRKLRYPRLEAMEAAAAGFSRRHARGVRFAPPRNFEGERITVEFSFRDRDEYRRRVDALNLAEEDVDELLGLLF